MVLQLTLIIIDFQINRQYGGLGKHTVSNVCLIGAYLISKLRANRVELTAFRQYLESRYKIVIVGIYNFFAAQENRRRVWLFNWFEYKIFKILRSILWLYKNHDRSSN